MIAVVSVPAVQADSLPGRRINPFGAAEAERGYVLARIQNDSPLALAMVLWRDDDSRVIRWFRDDRDAILWATVDALQRWQASEEATA